MNPKNFTKGQVQNAINNTHSMTKAAEYLHCSYNTLKRYAKRYDLFETNKNQSGRGITKDRSHLIRDDKINERFADIFLNHPHFRGNNEKDLS